MNKKRPVNLDLGTLAFPPMAIASILHRLAGIALFLLLPLMLYFLAISLKSAASFAMLQEWLQMPLVKLIVWAFVSALAYHLIAGIRHIVMDMGCGETLEAGRKGAVIVISLSVIAFIGLGVWIW